MRFLKQMESDAVNRLLTIVPVFYCLTLLIVFFWSIMPANISWNDVVMNSASI